MSKIDCNVIKDLLPLYHDKVTSIESKRLVDTHLNECESCKTYLKDIEQTSSDKITNDTTNISEDNILFSNIAEKFKKRNTMIALIVTTSLIILLVITYIMCFKVFSFHEYQGMAMEHAIGNGETVIVSKFAYSNSSPKRDDIVEYTPKSSDLDSPYCKRIVAIPGDTVEIKDTKLYVNNELYELLKDKEIEYPGILSAGAITL